MECPNCNGKVRVVSNVDNLVEGETYRKRRCYKCGYEFYTVEYAVERNERFRRDWTRWYKYHRNNDN